MLKTINACSEEKKRVVASKLTRLTHKITVKLRLVAESCIISSSRSRCPVRKLLDTPSYLLLRCQKWAPPAWEFVTEVTYSI